MSCSVSLSRRVALCAIAASVVSPAAYAEAPLWLVDDRIVFVQNENGTNGGCIPVEEVSARPTGPWVPFDESVSVAFASASQSSQATPTGWSAVGSVTGIDAPCSWHADSVWGLGVQVNSPSILSLAGVVRANGGRASVRLEHWGNLLYARGAPTSGTASIDFASLVLPGVYQLRVYAIGAEGSAEYDVSLDLIEAAPVPALGGYARFLVAAVFIVSARRILCV